MGEGCLSDVCDVDGAMKISCGEKEKGYGHYYSLSVFLAFSIIFFVEREKSSPFLP